MTMLPQLERELLEAHERQRAGRRGWGRPRVGWSGFVAAAAVCAAVVIAVVGIEVVGHGRRGGTGSPTSGITQRIVVVHSTHWQPARLLVRFRSPYSPDVPPAYAGGGSLYLAEQSTSEHGKVVRLDPASGAVLAVRQLPGVIDHILRVGGSLYVTTTVAETTALARLNPQNLTGRPPTILGPRGPSVVDVGSMALAGGWLWVGLSEGIVRVSPLTGSPGPFVPIAGGRGVQVASDAAGRVLVDSEGDVNAYVVRRDPRTGAPLVRSQRILAVNKARIGGVIDGGVWVSWATGMMGAWERLDLGTLRPMRSPLAPGQFFTNGVDAQILDGILWVTQLDGGPQRNFCGDPATGKRRISFPFDGSILTADRGSIYVSVPTAQSSALELLGIPIPRACR